MSTSPALPARFRDARTWSLTASILLATVRVAAADPAALQPMAAGTATAQPTADPITDEATPRQRPRIGLVLGGGGAKGAAHVGVLAALEELRVPIDCVVGTSMGALVGGTFAAGRTAHEVEEAVRAISWQDAIARRGQRGKVPMRRKLAGGTYSNGLEFGLRDGRLTAPSGFISTQNIDLTIQYLVARSRDVTDFDQLPIPFRAVATDMQRGEMVVLSSGDLARAMRASMAVPGVFAPVTIDDRILGDGGLTRNVPIDIARETCADVVIAAAVPNPTPEPEDLRSPLTLVARTLDVMIGANERQQLATLGPQDVKIVIDMGDIGSASFDRIADAIPVGRTAALAHRAELERYALPEAEYRAWRTARARPPKEPMTLAGVTVNGAQRVNEEFVRRTLALQAGDVVDSAELANRINRVFALSDFEAVGYGLSGEPERPNLDVELLEKSWGPNILRFDLGFHIGTDTNTAFTIGGDFLRAWINDRGGEIHGSARIGRTSGLDLALYQPLDPAQRWFVEPGLTLERSLEDVFADGESVARYRLSSGWGYLDAGRVFGNHTELRAGLRAGSQSVRREIGTPDLPEISSEGYGGIALRLTRDTRDRDVLWADGTLLRATYFRGVDGLGAVDDYDRFEAMAVTAVPFGDSVAYLRASGGSAFGSELPVYDAFTLGGPVSMPGFNIGELRGSNYWSAQASFLRRVADISYVFGQALYAGLNFTVTDIDDRIGLALDEPVYSTAFVLTGRTPLGPVALSLAITSESDWQLVFGLGRPIEERAITDPVW
jgi:NTE family protein